MYKTQLKTTELGATGLEITRVGFGAWALGGGGDRGWGPQDDEESIAATHRALEVGVNWIDRRPAQMDPIVTAAGLELAKAEELGYARRDIAAFFEVLARMAGAPGSAARPARSGTLTVGTAGSTR